MNNSDDEKLCDILIGEAVIGLLKENAGISRRSLLNKLQAMLSSEHDEARCRATKLAIQDVRAEMSSRGARTASKRTNVKHLIAGNYGDDDSTRH